MNASSIPRSGIGLLLWQGSKERATQPHIVSPVVNAGWPRNLDVLCPCDEFLEMGSFLESPCQVHPTVEAESSRTEKVESSGHDLNTSDPANLFSLFPSSPAALSRGILESSLWSGGFCDF